MTTFPFGMIKLGNSGEIATGSENATVLFLSFSTAALLK
jgi:hypothetical protein